MRISRLVKGFVLAGATMTAMTLGQTTAAAEVLEQPTPESVAALQSELEAQGIAPSESTADGVLTKQYTVETSDAPRVVIQTTEPAPTPPGQITPRLRAGVGNGIYVYLNRTDQNALIYGGSAALGAALCAIPAVGTAGCAGIAGALGAASTYLAANGFCANELEINYLGFPDPRPSFKCV